MEKIKNNSEQQEIEKKKETKESSADLLLKKFEEMEKRIEEQQKVIAKQNETIAKLSSNNVSAQGGEKSEEFISLIKELTEGNNKQNLNMVKVIFLDNVAQAMFKLQNGRIVKFNSYGQIVPLVMEDAMLLLNEYTATFQRGALKFDEEHMYMLREKGIEVDKIDYSPLESIKKFSELDVEGVKNLYNSLKAFQKDMLKTHIIGLMKEGKIDDSFVEKVKTLNKISRVDSIDGKTGTFKFILDKLKEGDFD